MGILYQTDKRSTIPRWRNHNLALGSGELSPLITSSSTSPIDFSKNSLKEQIFSWNKFKTISHAADLFSSAYTFGIENEFTDVALFLLENKDKISNVLLRQIEEVIVPDQKDPLSIDVEFNFFSEEGKEKTIKDLSTLRNYLRKEPKNPLGWIELARNHSLLGNVQKSIDCIQTALHVNETSDRFVLRSASRFFHHLGDNEQAHSIIRKAKYLKSDPWLISSEIAFSSILNRKSTLIKDGKEIIKNQKFTPFQISELASALATNEIFNGDLKNAKAFFKTALVDPNDNSLAQFLWFQERFPYLNITDEQLRIPLAFEAQTQSFYNDQKYEDAFKSSVRWLNDEPYSTRPVRVASYISTIFLNDTRKSIEILKYGLKVNPHDMKLLNNLSYNLLLEDRIKEAEDYFTGLKYEYVKGEETSTKISLVATLGLYLFRNGNIEQGRQHYLESINYTIKKNDNYLTAIAIVNYVREEMILYTKKHPMSDISKIHTYMAKLIEISKNLKFDDVTNLTNKALNEYEKIKNV